MSDSSSPPKPPAARAPDAKRGAARRRSLESAVVVRADSEPPRAPTWFEHLSERLVPWRIPLLALVGIVLFAGTRFDSTQPIEAMCLALGLPALGAVLGVAPLQHTALTLRRAAWIAAGGTVLIAELVFVRVLFPPPPLASTLLDSEHPDATLEAPADSPRFEVETRGHLAHLSGSAEGSFSIQFERGSAERWLNGSFSRSVAMPRMGRRGVVGSASVHTAEVDRQSVELDGVGPVHAHLASINGSIARKLTVSILRPLPARGIVGAALIALGLLACVVQALAARRGFRSHLAAWTGVVVGLVWYLPYHFTPDDALGALLSALLVSLLIGGGAGLLLGALANRLWGA